MVLCNLRRRGWKISYFGPESVGVPLQYDRHGFLPDRFIIDVVAATIAIAISAVIAACEAFAVEFQAPRVLAVATLSAAARLGLREGRGVERRGEIEALLRVGRRWLRHG